MKNIDLSQLLGSMAPNGMTALRFDKAGAITDILHISDGLPVPTATSEEAVIQIKAAAINPADIKNIQGSFPNTTFPRTPGRDYAGIVTDGPPHLIGKKVWGTGGTSGLDRDGSHAEYILVPINGIAEMPSNLTFTQAAACGVGFLTAACMLRRAGVKRGDYVLILGSSGAVGSAAVQVAKSLGATPIETSRRPTPDAVITTSSPAEFLSQVHILTDNKGVTATLDTVADQELFRKSIPCLKNGGNHVIISRPKETANYTFDCLDLYRANRAILGVNTFTVGFEEAKVILDGLKSGFEDRTLLPPKIIEEVDLKGGKVVDAYQRISQGARGKFVIVNKED